ncbi:YcaO-like family protein [Microbulbifer sp. 2205BS26-8]|uniref:YcaO-like family protein n=1 Tax=Microbulbifer sp. 2205BS26-8 TaxID=3064386 RepID=UPI00273DD5D5|nr:YcaO-like family protein [Microbulbifer sp. 2205BS26-8]MDP5210786.1 YcaO-like family protein [Microbulbifer sp. 2205BS26-8]
MKVFGQCWSARKGHLQGTHRTRAPEETLEDYGRFLPQLGITRIANVTGLDRIGLPVCVAIRPNARALATTQGKGETLAAAKASAMMEAIESWHGEHISGPLWSASYRELVSQGPMPDPQLLALRSDASWDANRPIDWIEGEDLFSGERLLLPFETVSNNFVEQPDYRPIFLKSTNGLASGNHLLEALLHGLLEVVERDALTLWELQPETLRKSRQLDLTSIYDPHLAEIIQVLNDRGVVLAAWDITSDLGLPTFTCTLAENPDSPLWRPVAAVSGHGTHLQSEIALSRAIHEAIQSRVTMISGSRDDMFPRDYRDAGGRDAHARLIRDWREPAPALALRQSEFPLGDNFEQDLATVLERLRAVGIEHALAVDLRRKDVDIPVVKVVVPGLEAVRTAVYRPGPRAQKLLQRGFQ